MRRSACIFAGLVIMAASAFAGDGSVRRTARHIPGRYIVVLEQSADTATVANVVRNLNGRVHRIYERGIHGLSIEVTDADAQALSRDARVAFVEEDAAVAIASTPWGLDRIDQRTLPLDDTFTATGTGAGVSVYVVDTGILAAHEDFGGRVAAGFSAFADGNGSNDCNGHGTHVAGIIAGTNYGVAKSATLVPVRVLDCSGAGSLSTVIAGLDWVMQDHAQSSGPAVVNMSLAGGASTALDTEVNSVIAAGITVVAAAGNGSTDACGSSPARVPGVLTVGSSTETDAQASFSNYGSCVDLFAPGTNVVSDWYSSTTATAISSGTSESAPFAAGVAAVALEKDPTASPSTVSQTILTQATPDVLTSLATGSANLLLYSSIDSMSPATADAQLLSDPSFESGTTFWTASICTVIQQAGCPPDDEYIAMSLGSHSGKSHAVIGGPAKTFHLMSESVTVPADVKKAEVDLYLWIVTKDRKPIASDVLTIEIRDASGALLANVGTFSNLDANAAYALQRFNITRFRGMTIRIAFTGAQSQGPPTWFLLDDVNVNIWR